LFLGRYLLGESAMKRVALLFLLLTSACHSDTSDKPSDKTELVTSKEEVMSHDAEQE
jgi:hypothetical protein